MVVLEVLGSRAGRVARVTAGLGLVAAGLRLGGGWRALAVAGLVPLGAGLADRCVLGPLAGLPFSGPEFRRRMEQR